MKWTFLIFQLNINIEDFINDIKNIDKFTINYEGYVTTFKFDYSKSHLLLNDDYLRKIKQLYNYDYEGRKILIKLGLYKKQ